MNVRSGAIATAIVVSCCLILAVALSIGFANKEFAISAKGTPKGDYFVFVGSKIPGVQQIFEAISQAPATILPQTAGNENGPEELQFPADHSPELN